MTIYTIMPEEIIFHDVEHQIFNEQLFRKNGISFLGERLNNGSVKVNRIMSTNPNDYLSTSVSPGAIINNPE